MSTMEALNAMIGFSIASYQPHGWRTGRSEYIVACRRFPTSENNCQSSKRNSNRNLGLKKEVNPVHKRQNLRIDGTSRRAGRQALLG
jgi:hypothetical protein